MIDKAIQKIRATIIFIFCILIYFFLMQIIFFLTHLISRNFWWILVSKDVENFEKTQVEEDLSFPPLEVGSLKAKWLVEISNKFIWFLLCRALFKEIQAFGWLNFVTGAEADSFPFLIPPPFTFPLRTYLAQYLRQFMLAH